MTGLLFSALISLVQAWASPELVSIRVVDLDSRAVSFAPEWPSALPAGRAVWTWSAGCAPIRLEPPLPATPPCVAGIKRVVEVAKVHGSGTLSLVWGTAEMIRELPDRALPSQWIVPGAQSKLLLPATARSYARLRGSDVGTHWRELTSNPEVLVPRPGRAAGIQLIANRGKPPVACTSVLADADANQSEQLTYRDDCFGKSGNVDTPVLPDGISYRVKVAAPGFVPRILTSDVRGLPSHLEMDAGASLRGRVVDESRSSLPSARVSVRFLFAGQWEEQRVTAAANGAFLLSGVPRGSIEVISEHRDRSTNVRTVLSDGIAPIDLGDITLSRGIILPVRVVGPGDLPVRGATVHVQGSRQIFVTDAGGAVSLAQFPTWGAELRITAPGFLPLRQLIEPGRDMPKPVVLHLQAGAGIRFRVVHGAAGSPPWSGNVILQHDGKSITDSLAASGVFESLSLQPGRYSVTIHATGVAAYQIPDQQQLIAGSVVDLGEVHIPTGTIAVGRVVDAATGSSIPAAHVIAMPATDFGPALSRLSHDRIESTTDPDGRFELALAPGRYSMTADAPRFARTVHNSFDVAKGDERVDVGDVRMPAAHTLIVHCAPVEECGSEARLLVGGVDRDWAAVAGTLYAGSVELPSVPAGRHALRLSSDQGVLYEQDVEISDASETTEVHVDIRKTAVLGKMICNGSAPNEGDVLLTRDIAGKLVTVTQITDTGTAITENVSPFARRLVASVGAGGVFSFPGVSPGRYRLIYERDGGRSPEQIVIIPAGDVFSLTVQIDGMVVAGRVVDEGEQGVADALVLLVHGQIDVASTSTRRDGAFSFVGVVPGDFLVRAATRDAFGEVALAVSDATPPRLKIVIKPAGRK